ncbi:MAG: hypothetical protein ACRCU1_18965 [Alsobacter sp.]
MAARGRLGTPAAQLADRVARGKVAGRDPTGRHMAAVCVLARRTKIDPLHLLDDWDERAAVREFEGGLSRALAEEGAVVDVESMTIKQTEMI